MRWNTKDQVAPNGEHWVYRYLYNKNNWLKEAKFGTYNPACQNLAASATPCGAGVGPIITFDANNAYMLDNLTYDEVGNIHSLRRKADAGTLMDDFSYNYHLDFHNRLLNVNDAVTVSSNYEDLKNQALNNYSYDEMGRMTEDVQANHKLIYNSYGLVKEVQKVNGGIYVPIVKYFYDENGIRLLKETYNATGTAVTDKNWNVGSTQYRENLTASTTDIVYDINGSNRLGTFNRTGNIRVYEINDHLGNVRATFTKNNLGNLNLLSYIDYYPFGSEMPGRKFQSGDLYKHGYQGQFTIKDEEVNWDAFELRNWDGRLARWTSIDPYGQHWSPYLGMGNNPVNTVDPDGGYKYKWQAKLAKFFSGGDEVRFATDKNEWYVGTNISPDGESWSWHRNFGADFSVSANARVDYGAQGGFSFEGLGIKSAIFGAYETKPFGDIEYEWTPFADRPQDVHDGHFYDIVTSGHSNSRYSKTEVDGGFLFFGANNSYGLGKRGEVFSIGPMKSTSFSAPIYGTVEYSFTNGQRNGGVTRSWGVGGKAALILGIHGGLNVNLKFD